jgi:hypothetical protein
VNPILGWALAALLGLLAWQGYGCQGLLVAISVIVFWLLLQFNRSVRVMKNASGRPVGHVASAVMLNARLKPGMTLLEVIAVTRSLGRRLDEAGESWTWADDGGSRVTLQFERGKLARFELDRPAQAETPAP